MLQKSRLATLRVRRGFVKFNVRRHALALGTFTIADIVRVTGLNAKSVRTELERLLRDGYLAPKGSSAVSGKRGGPPKLYAINPERSSELAGSLDGLSVQHAATARPTSPHYLSARELLDRAQQTAAPDDREALLAAAEQCLVMAVEAEGGERAPDIVMLYLDYESARLLCLRGADDRTAERVYALCDRCSGVRDEVIVRHIEELRLYLTVHRSFIEPPGTAHDVAWAYCLLDTLEAGGYRPGTPLTALVFTTLARIVGRNTTERMQLFLYGTVPRKQPVIAHRLPGLAALPGTDARRSGEAALHVHKARAAFELEYYDEALTLFTQAIDFAPADPRSIAARGETFRRNKQYEEALADFGRAIELQPDFAWAIAARGHVHRLRGQHEKALSDLDCAIELDPGYAWAIAERGHVHFANVRFEAALADFGHAMSLEPYDHWMLASRAQVYRATRRYEEALADFSRAIVLSPEDAWWLLVSRGQIYATVRRYDEALSDFRRAIELNPNFPWPVAERARIYRITGQSDTARIEFERVQTIQSLDEVRGHLERTLAIISPEHPEVPTMRVMLERLRQPGASWEAMYDAYDTAIAV